MDSNTPVQPTQPTQPVQTVPPPAAPVQTSAAPQNVVPAAGGSKNLLLAVAAIAVLVVLVGGFFLYTMFLSPLAQAKRASNGFLKDLTSNDVAGALKQSSSSAANVKQFLAQAAPDVAGGYTLTKSKLQDGKGYFLYSLTNATNKYARTTMAKSGGSWKVGGFAYSATALALVPGSSSSSTSQTSTSAPSTTAPSDTSACLATSDYTPLVGYTNTIAWSASNPYTQNVHFNPDTLDFDDAAAENSVIASFVGFYQANPTKSYTIHLQGSVATTAQSDLDFANQRAAKVQSLLEAGGVPAMKLVIDTPHNVTALSGDSSDSVNQQTARSVVLTVIPTCSSDTSTGSYTGL